MRFLANENFPLVAVEALRRSGHDTAWVREIAPGIADEAVLERAAREGRLLLTFDKDFGALVFRRGATASRGIVLFRVVLPPESLARLVVDTLESRSDWEGAFSVVEAARVRMRRLPASRRR
jgi:predicted nuclease of predicted toxin-antitoxin system